VRAAAWIGAAALGMALRRPRPAAAWLALVLPWLLVLDPALVRSVSFRLSLGAVAGILFAAELAGERGRWKRVVVPLAASLGAQWGTLPVIVTVFGQLAPAATFPNLIAIPLTGLLLPALFLAAAAFPVPAVSALFLEAARVLALAILGVLEWSDAHLPLWTGLAPASPAVRVLFPVLLVAWFSLPPRLRGRGRVRAGAAAAAVFLAAAVLVPRGGPPGPWAAFLDVGQGDAAVVRLSDGTVWIVDVGDDRGPGDAATNALLPFLRTRGVRSVDGLILSHRHRDHVGGLAAFLDGIPVRRVYDAGFGGRGGTPAWVDSVLEAHALWPCLVAAGDTLHAAGAVSLVAIAPLRGDPEHPPRSLNDASLVVRLEDGPLTILFAGDAERGEEAACLDGKRVRAVRILKVGHHGSDTSTSPGFLHAADPDWGIISCGDGNRFGHPRAVTLDRLGCCGVRIARTDRDGAVEVSVRAGSLAVTTHPPRRPVLAGSEGL
jgi:competence protein ComEC